MPPARVTPAGSQSSETESAEFKVVVVPGLEDIGRADWDACLEGLSPGTSSHPANPFLTYDFLEALEASGCVSAREGWMPQHLTLRGENDEIVAAMPAYLKSHSMGEYVFDHAWAHAFERAGGDYYPKLQCSVPFTPVSGPRILVKPGYDRPTAEQALSASAAELTRRRGASSVHITFLQEPEWKRLGEAGYLLRTDRQFHWHNEGYEDFDGFLASLSSRKRKNIRKERQRATGDGIAIEWLTGDDIQPHHWDLFFRFYLDTGERKWGTPYLNRAFFTLLGERMPDHTLLILAKRDGRYIAGALNLIGADTLYGRYWGCLEDHDFLHFEVCYYQAMDYAIEHGLGVLEAGAQGEHKLARGYMPVTTYSAHHICHPGLAQAVAEYLEDERRYNEAEREALSRHGPYRRSG